MYALIVRSEWYLHLYLLLLDSLTRTINMNYYLRVT